MKIQLWLQGYVTDDISYLNGEKIDASMANLYEEHRVKFVTDLAAVSRGNSESINPAKRYKSLLSEAALGTASRPLEFLPVVVPLSYFDNLGYDINYNMVKRFSYTDENDIVYTNMRCLLNAGIKYEDIPYNTQEECKDFKAIKAKIPMYIWSQVPMTHTMISKESQSDRVAVQLDYWLPMDFEKRLRSHKKKVEEVKSILNDTLDNEPIETLFDQINHLDEVGEELEVTELEKHNMFIEIFTTMMSQEQVQLAFKTLGYKQEIWSRAPYYFKYKEVVMTGWYNDPLVWKHLFLERNTCPDEWKNWTQKETTEFVKAVKDIITAE